MMRRFAASLVLALGAAAPAGAVDWVPVFDASFLMGQVLQGGKASSWQGNAALQFTPAVKFTDELGLIPTYYGTYRGTKSAVDLGSGGQLFQDSQSHALSLKGVWKRDEWKVKPSLGYRWELLRETSDEGWGKGLFDYRKPSAGLEVERAFGERVRAGAAFDYYEIQFPNYRSLESQALPGLGRELAEGRTLDSRSYSWTLTGHFPLPFEGGAARLTGNFTRRGYPEQHVVQASGSLADDTRADDFSSVSAALSYGRALAPRVGGYLSLEFTQLRDASNQNHYDAEQARFLGQYYSYDERSLYPKLTMILGEKKVELAVGYLQVWRDYLGRAAQDASGTYLNESTRLDQGSFTFDLSLPLAHGFKALAHTTLTDASSNMRYEKTYRYNYQLSSHLLGFSYTF
ncbi:MAG: hypothetical protein HY926_12820 [Elusimicrobia bacterium]|nr:hypothetical protein [Elusimicrobiota bacterium]